MKDTKEHILETAFKLFMAKTFKEVTMKEIVEATSLSKGAFYHYFESKEQLFLEVIHDYLISNLMIDYSRFNQKSLHAFYTDHLNFVDRRISGDSTHIFYKQDLTYSKLYTLIFESIKLFPEQMTKFRELDAYKLDTWTTVIQNAKASGEINSEISSENIAKIFLSISESTGIRLAWTLDGSQDQKNRLSELWNSYYHHLKS